MSEIGVDHTGRDEPLPAVGAASPGGARLERGWRVLATGFCFACFGVGGLLIGLAFPLLLVALRERERRAAFVRGGISRLFVAFVGLMLGLGVCSLEVRGRERLQRRGLLILANHPSLIDVVFLMALVRDADCIVKSALLRNPFTRGPVRAAGFVCNDSGPGLVDDCVASVRAGRNLIVFPEGTRTPAGQRLGPLQRGAAQLAVRGGLAITPVRIACSERMLGKTDKWWRVPRRAGRFVIEIGDDIPAQPPMDEAAYPRAARRLNEELTRRLGAETTHATA